MKESPILTATIVSDVHMDFSNPNIKLLLYGFKCALKATKSSGADAFITVGDTTSHGVRANWDYARSCFNEVKNCAENIILTVGNHDCWSDGDDEYASGIGEYYNAVKDIAGISLKKPYYSTVIKGYSFICLGNESDAGCEANISDEQLAWLKKELEKATQGGKPAFVFCHQSLNGRHGLPRTWDKNERDWSPETGGVGEKSEELAALLKSFKNVFYFSGHSHMGLCGEDMLKREGYSSFELEDGLHRVNLPCLSRVNHHGEIKGRGIGLQLEVYENKVILRPKNYITGKWIKQLNIKGGKPYYSVKLLSK